MKLGYIRVSTAEQNYERQLNNLEQYGIDKYFTEKVSAKDANRPELQNLIDWARDGDSIYVDDFSRLARNTRDLLEIVERLEAKGVQLISNKERLDTSTPTGKLMLTVMGAIATFERTIMLERQKEGVAIAKTAGKYKGRQAIQVRNVAEHYGRYMRREITKPKLAAELGISRNTLDRLFNEYTSKETLN
jgi:DNA invertase Pin-like site-specific DNA recombinase